MIGKHKRLNRILDKNSGRTIVVPLDHGMTLGPIAGIENIGSLLKQLSNPSPNAVVLHKGELIRFHQHISPETGIFMHLSASISFSPSRMEKVLVGTVEEAVQLGADGVSIHVNLGCSEDRSMLKDAGMVSRACMKWGMPLLMMIYPQYSAHGQADGQYMDQINHSIRICEELGADLVKVPVPKGQLDRFIQMVNHVNIPVLAAGGEHMDSDTEYMDQVKELMTGNTAGVCVGRNVFQHANPASVLSELNQIVHGIYMYT